MSLAAGSSLGPYEIVAPIGAGGMGEVYKARDTRLDRIVAIKVLPAKFSGRDDLRLRFEREARIISSLNHPHICTLHDVGTQDGVSYLVMEYLEGETLAARLKRGPLPVEEALPLAIEILEALTEAHGRDLIHRDLKPANVMLTRSGVKLLDFGLAKAMGTGKGIGPDEATLTAALSSEGTFMGTLQYMAPEQLEGKEADARSDLFAFGCLLYEMVTGKRAFSGESHASVVGAIMTGEPPAITSLVPVAPQALERLIRQCMRKKPGERFQSAHDIKVQLEWIRQPLEEKAAPARSPRERWIWAAAVVVLAAGLAAAMALRPGPPPDPPPVKVEIQPEERDTVIANVSVSPKGDTIAWRALNITGDKLLVRSLATGATRVVANEGGVIRAWSPDGQSLLYTVGGKMKRVDLTGGGVQMVCNCVGWADWSLDGTIVLTSPQGLMRTSASGGAPVPLLQLDKERGEAMQLFPVSLPDGKRLLYGSRARNNDLSGVYVASLDGSTKPRRIHPTTQRFWYIHPNRLLIQHGEGLAAVRVDVDGGGQPAGEPVVVAQSIGTGTPGVSFRSSQDGKVIAMLTGAGPVGADMSLVDRSGKRLAVISPGTAGAAGHPDFSPDGKRVVFDRTEGGVNGDMWIYDIARQASSRLTFGPGQDNPGVWSATGDRIFYYSGRDAKASGIYEIASNGVGTEKLVGLTEAHHLHVSPDGKLLAFERTASSGGGDLWTLPLTGGGKEAPLLTGHTYSHPRISPDSRLFSYSSPETGRPEIYIQTLPPGGGKWQVSTTGGGEPKWRSDGKEIYFLAGNRVMAAAITIRGSAVEVGEVKELFQVRKASGAAGHFAASPDGKLFAISLISDRAQDQPITILLNWKLP
ncbi:MAG: protein kinase [Acidobacteriia bacterium]|nr:protein kinase [Terriglobia bacterium]